MTAVRQAFTLVEMLLVLLIVVIIMGMVFAVGGSDQREEAVRGAAEELAAVLRETRARAIRTNTPYGVAFNITNAPGSSGRILNNRGGGHWYRVVGPRDTLNGDGYYTSGTDARWNQLPLIDMNRSSLNGVLTNSTPPPIEHYLELVSRSWIDEPHTLPRNKVRFLALTDQDNGDNAMPSQGGYYTATYPRPWFGWWDTGSGALHAWGGYDPALKGESQRFLGWGIQSIARNLVNGRLASPSGFYYEGWDGEITGCVNPVDRLVLHDDPTAAGGSIGVYDNPDVAAAKPFAIYRAGEPRPLINGAWLDYVLCFRADGTVVDDWFRLRQGYWRMTIDNSPVRADNQDPFVPSYPPLSKKHAGLMDRANGCARRPNWEDTRASYVNRSTANREATTYVHRTGYYWLTLAPDATGDGHTFASATDALRSLTPLYRVGVSPYGQVKVIRVRNTYQGTQVFDSTITGADWQDKNKIWGKNGATWSPNVPITRPNYVNHELREIDGSPRGAPVHDIVLPEMLSGRTWWWAP